jgi:hypothetical protein
MTTIVIEKSPEGAYKGFTCMGHAGYARKGKPDILCSAVSAITFHTINGMEIAGQKPDVTSNDATGFIRCVIPGEPIEGTRVLMDAFVNTMKNLSEEYGEKFLQIQFKEVKDNA